MKKKNLTGRHSLCQFVEIVSKNINILDFVVLSFGIVLKQIDNK